VPLVVILVVTAAAEVFWVPLEQPLPTYTPMEASVTPAGAVFSSARHLPTERAESVWPRLSTRVPLHDGIDARSLLRAGPHTIRESA